MFRSPLIIRPFESKRRIRRSLGLPLGVIGALTMSGAVPSTLDGVESSLSSSSGVASTGK